METPRSSYRYGLFGHSGINLHKPSFDALPGTENCCNIFDEGIGLGLSIGAFFDYYFDKNTAGEIRVGFAGLSGDLTAAQYVPYSEINLEEIGVAEIEHLIQAEISAVSVELMIRYALLDKLFLLGGINLSYMAGGTFFQEERLIAPSDRGTFENGLRVRNRQNGSILEMNKIMAFLNAGISYDLPLNLYQTLLFSPEVILSYGLNDFLKTDRWTLNIVRIGISLSYHPFGQTSTPLEPFHD